MYTGSILKMHHSGEWGFVGIIGRRGDLWFHASELKGIDVNEQLIGRRVRCEIEDTSMGPRAVRIEPA